PPPPSTPFPYTPLFRSRPPSGPRRPRRSRRLAARIAPGRASRARPPRRGPRGPRSRGAYGRRGGGRGIKRAGRARDPRRLLYYLGTARSVERMLEQEPLDVREPPGRA